MANDNPVDEEVGTAGEEGTGPAEQPRSKRLLWLLGGGAVLVVLLAGLAYGWMTAKDDATHAEPGDCLTALGGTEEIDIRDTKVDCGDAAAAYKVLGIVENVTLAQASGTTCAQWTATTVPIWISGGEQRNTPGKVVCLQAITK